MKRRHILLVPFAGLFAVMLIGVSLFIVTRSKTDTNAPEQTKQVENVRTVQKDDHILGSPSAPIVIVEYSDYECQFCKEYHAVLHRILNEYGPQGSVAWVFRQLPITQLHSQAPTEALASECVASLGGNSAFWAFTDELYRVTPGNNQFNLADLPKIAVVAGVDRTAFEACMKSGNLMKRVEKDFAEGVAAGAVGTPFTVIQALGQQSTFSGLQSYLAIHSIIESVLRQVGTEGLLPPTALPATEIPWDSASTTDASASSSADAQDTEPDTHAEEAQASTTPGP